MVESYVRSLYKDEHNSCARTVLLSCQRLWGVLLEERDLRLLEIRSDLLRLDDMCSAYTCGINLLYHLISEDKLHVNADVEHAVGELLRQYFLGTFGGLRCSSIRRHFAKQDVRCLYVVTEAVRTLHEMVTELPAMKR